MKLYKVLLPILAGFMLIGIAGGAVAAMEPKHKVVIQVSGNDPVAHVIALNNAVQMQKEVGMDNIAIEVVAYGPGLTLLTAGNKNAERVKSLALQDITFSACGNTMKKVAAKTGEMPVLTEGVGVVPAGAIQIMKLQEAGYSYLRP